MKHIEQNLAIAIAGKWFTAHGKGINLGYLGKTENQAIADKLKNPLLNELTMDIIILTTKTP